MTDEQRHTKLMKEAAKAHKAQMRLDVQRVLRHSAEKTRQLLDPDDRYKLVPYD